MSLSTACNCYIAASGDSGGSGIVVTVVTVGTVVVVVMVVVAMIALKAAGAAVVARAMAAIARQATQTVQHHKKLWAKKRRFFPGLYVWELRRRAAPHPAWPTWSGGGEGSGTASAAFR